MTKSTPKLEKTVSDVGINMMGIKSRRLYELLKIVVENGDLSALKASTANEMIPELIQHMTVTIPNDILRNFNQSEGKDDELLKNNLREVGEFLRKNFSEQNKYPFTILRICELCYDPLKYYKIHELKKFVSGICKCCLVLSSWEYCEDSNGFNIGSDNDNSDQGEDVSLTKIPWIDEDAEKELVPFLKEIDILMSANFGFEDDDEDEDMDVDINDSNNRNGDFIIEEYYEGPGNSDGVQFDDDEDDEDYDDDYVETPTSDDNEQWMDEDDTEEEKYNGPRGKDELEDNNEVTHRKIDSADVNVSHHEKTLGPEKTVAYKRKPTELDDFQYREASNTMETHQMTTPKKLKQGRGNLILESPEVAHSDNDENVTPIHSQEEVSESLSDKQSQSPDPEQQVSMLISPKTNDEDHVSQQAKIRGVLNRGFERDHGSPLGNKTR